MTLSLNPPGSGSMLGIAGALSGAKRAVVSASCGIAGNLAMNVRAALSHQLGSLPGLFERDRALAAITAGSSRLGDRAARLGANKAFVFSSFGNDVTPYHPTSRGGYSAPDHRELRWRPGREQLFGRSYRTMPYLIDSMGFGKILSGSAAQWTHDIEVFHAAIACTDPDGYAAFDDPKDQRRSMEWLHQTIATFPADATPEGRLWPIFSARWGWDDAATLDWARLWPRFRGHPDLRVFIPFNDTQFRPKDATLERMARRAIANAQRDARDPDLRAMAERFGRVMIGGLVKGPCDRLARHLYAAQLAYELGDCKLWLLGQASATVVNGLGYLELLDRVSVDGSWWVKDATAGAFGYVKDGLITMLQLGRGRRQDGQLVADSFFALPELMAANLRSLISAYAGLWNWPKTPAPPIDPRDHEQLVELKRHYQQAQFDLGL